jgi:xanthine dehydrogenase YagS FAD-binding subunit
MKLQIETPTHLIDVNGLALDKIEPTPEGGLRIGAPFHNTDLAPDARSSRSTVLANRRAICNTDDRLASASAEDTWPRSP